MLVMLVVEFLIGLLVIIQVEPMPIIGSKMKQWVLVKIVPFDFPLLNEDITAGKHSHKTIHDESNDSIS